VALADELVPYPGPLLHAERLRDLGYRVRFETYIAEHLTFSFNDEYGPGAAFLGDAPVLRNPARIRYLRNPAMDFPDRGVVADHVYWLSGLDTADGGPAEIEAVSHALGASTAAVEGPTPIAGTLTGGVLPALAFTGFEQHWGPERRGPAEDRLALRARNLAAATVHPGRAGLSCAARVDADIDRPLSLTWAGCGRVDRLSPP
jgi:hypothetical protein